MTRARLTPFAWLFGGRQKLESTVERRSRGLRPPLRCEALEGRVVLSHGGFGGFEGPRGLPQGSSLTSDLVEVGVLANFSTGLNATTTWRGATLATSQLMADLTKLKTDLATLAAKSEVTLVDISNLRANELAIREAGFQPDADKLESAVNTLARAVASGVDTSAAKDEFAEVFAGSSVSQETIDKTFADLVQTIQNSNVTIADLDMIAADRAAVKTSLDALQASDGYGNQNKGGGGSLIGSLSKLGIVSGLGKGSRGGRGTLRGPIDSNSALATDIEKLRTDLQTLAAKSEVTLADLTSLRSDAQAIAEAGFRPDVAKLDQAVSDLAYALVSGMDTSEAKAEFEAVFSGSTVSQDTIDKTFSDLSETITDSNVTKADLETIAADRAAIAAELASLKTEKLATSSSSTTNGSSTTSSSTGTSAGSSTGAITRRMRARARAAARRARS